jgi:transposase
MARIKSKRNKILYTIHVGQTNETELNMIYEPFDWNSEEKAYKAQLEKEAEDYAFALQEIQRREWAQRHGNDSGFDPYADFDE